VLKAYKRAVSSVWGQCHIGLTSVTTISSIESIRVANARSSGGKEFEVTTKVGSGTFSTAGTVSNDGGSVNSDMTAADGPTKTLTFRAVDAEVRYGIREKTFKAFIRQSVVSTKDVPCNVSRI
jgi:hypothetical protein